MRVAVVIIHGAEQVANLPRIRVACASLDGVVVVCGEDIPDTVPPSTVPGFNAGANRDIGIAEARRRFPGCSVLLLDGDCVPGPTWTESHRLACEDPRPTIACGSRNEGGINDPRTQPLTWRGTDYRPSFIPGGRSDCSLDEILAHRITWTCNLSINAAALDLLEAAGSRIHGCPRIFAPMFDGQWGGEDTGLGILAHYAGCRILTLDPDASAVDHQLHKPRITTVENLRRVHSYAASVKSYFSSGKSPFHTHETSRRLDMSTPETTADKISPEDLARVFRANTKLAHATDKFQKLQDEVSKARDEVIGARAILVDLSEEIAEKYGIKDGDTMDTEGTITRKAG